MSGIDEKIAKIELQILQQEDVVQKANEKLDALKNKCATLKDERDKQFADDFLKIILGNGILSSEDRAKFLENLKKSFNAGVSTTTKANENATTGTQTKSVNPLTEELDQKNSMS